MNPKLLLVANWKANFPAAWFREFSLLPAQFLSYLDVAIAPPYPHISDVPQNFIRCAQDLSAFSPGAYTGEVPAKLLADLGVKYCLVGHSERRKYLGETTEAIGKKALQALENRITPIVCARNFEEIPRLASLPQDGPMVMFEPEEAISSHGEYHPATPEEVRRTLAEWQRQLGPGMRFLYGGSINPDNVSRYLSSDFRPLLSGFVIGHASLEMQTFFAILKQCLPTVS